MTTAAPAAPSHKERLIRAGLKLFYEQGFNGTSIDGVLAEAGVPKGSFYHHFGSKDAFARAVLNRYIRSRSELVTRWAAKKNLSTADKLVGCFREMSQNFVKSGYQTACLTGKFSTEVAATSDVFRHQLDAQITGWKALVADLLAAGQDRGDVRTDRSADELADTVLALIQGAFVLTLSTRDKHTLAAVAATIREVVEPRSR